MTHTPMAAILHTFQLATRTPGQLRPPNLDSSNGKNVLYRDTWSRSPQAPPISHGRPHKFCASQHFSALNLNRGLAGTLNNVRPPNMEDRILGARHLGPEVQQSNR